MVLGRSARDTAAERTPSRATEGSGERGGQRGERRVAAWIGASIVIQGDVVSSEDTSIAGTVEGNVQCRDHALVVAAGARIEGNVHARTVSLSGTVVGTVTAEQSIQIGTTGSVIGDVSAPRMSIAEGGVLSGNIRIAAGARQAVPATNKI